MTDTSSTAGSAKPPADDLPPVQPPSAGFILQLFVVPALIVLAIVAAWGLFGRLAAGEQDWRQLAQEMESSNPHIYRRAMFGMAQLLDTDRRQGDQGQHLASNPEVAKSLAALFRRQLDSRQVDEDTLSAQVYLSRALGLLDVPETTLPVLIDGLDAQRDVEVRKGSVTSIAMIAGRALEREQPLETVAVAEALTRLSLDPDPGLRRVATFTLGLIPGPESEARLLVLLQDASDPMTTMNAAIALSRRGSTAGFDVFMKSLATPADNTSLESRQDRLLILRNTLKAVGELAEKFDPEQRQQLRTLVSELAAHDDETRIRIDAQAALVGLDGVK